MVLETFQFFKETGWTIPKFPDVDGSQTLILIFAAPEFINHPEPIEELAKKYSKSIVIGCSSSGEISGAKIFDHSLSVAIIKFEKTPLKLVTTEINESSDSFEAGKFLATELTNQEKLKGIFVLSKGLNVNGSELVQGLNSIQNKDIVITGGLAGDGSNFKQTWIILQGKLFTNKVVAVGFYGDHVKINHGSKGGWDIFGPERHITRSKNNILYELDGKSALDLYKQYLGDKALGLPATGLLFPLAIRKDTDAPKQLVRTILAVDEKEKSLTFAGDIPLGYLAQLMRANFDRIISGAVDAGTFLLEHNQFKNKDSILLVAISCVGRRLLLGERTEEETESVLQLFPEGTKQIGFYSYGEISPFTSGECDLHNQTMTLTTFTEES